METKSALHCIDYGIWAYCWAIELGILCLFFYADLKKLYIVSLHVQQAK